MLAGYFRCTQSQDACRCSCTCRCRCTCTYTCACAYVRAFTMRVCINPRRIVYVVDVYLYHAHTENPSRGRASDATGGAGLVAPAASVLVMKAGAAHVCCSCEPPCDVREMSVTVPSVQPMPTRMCMHMGSRLRETGSWCMPTSMLQFAARAAGVHVYRRVHMCTLAGVKRVCAQPRTAFNGHLVYTSGVYIWCASGDAHIACTPAYGHP